MESLKSKRHVELSSQQLADWITKQPDCWWYVDGDPWLTSRYLFPCPSEEMATALEAARRNVLILDERDATDTEQVAVPDELDRLANRDNRLQERTWLCSWEGDDAQWLLAEDKERGFEE